jgi:hypothetical protein
MRGVTSALYFNLRENSEDLLKIFLTECHCSGPDVLLQPVQLRRSRDWNHPRFLSEDPGEGNLSWCHLLLLGDLAVVLS